MTLLCDTPIYLIYPYYDNPTMLERQVQNWNRFCGDLASFIEVIVIDDCSPNHPAAPIMEKCKIKKRLYRVKKNIPWAQHHARNIGAFEASKDGNAWLFMSDMDILFTPEAANTLFEKKLNSGNFHTFERHFLGEPRPEKYHCNTFLVKHHHYWAINGYDVDYCGTYGGDGRFLKQLAAICPQEHHGKQEIHLPKGVIFNKPAVKLFGCEFDGTKDANTKEFRRDGKMKENYRKIMDEKRRRGDERSLNPIRWPYERIL